MPRLPVAPLIRPSVLSGRTNGKLPKAILESTPGRYGGAEVVLVAPAARSWRAMVSAAASVGIQLKINRTTNSYRPYAEQERIFRARYYPSIFGTKRWQGRRWRKLGGVAAAATPGFSNHGLGLAVDIANLQGAALVWMINNAHRYGFSAEIQSEPWHWRYVNGDRVPPAVLAFENNTPTSTEEDSMILLHDTQTDTFRVAVPGEGSAVIDSPMHWASVIAAGRKSGVYASAHMDELLDKIRAER